jgi:hypothetical protein
LPTIVLQSTCEDETEYGVVSYGYGVGGFAGALWWGFLVMGLVLVCVLVVVIRNDF